MIKHEFITLHGRSCCLSYDQSSNVTKGYDIEDKGNTRVFMTQDGPFYYHKDKYHKRRVEYAHIVCIMSTRTRMEYQLGLVAHGYQDN